MLRATLRLALVCFLLGGAAVAQSFLSVGARGTHSTIQSAIDDALLLGVPEIRVGPGVFTENLTVDLHDAPFRLSGGWEPRFFRRQVRRFRTVIDGGGADRVLRFSCQGDQSRVEISNLVLRNGVATAPAPDFMFANRAAGGGIYYETYDCVARFSDLVVEQNTAQGMSSGPSSGTRAFGGGMFIFLEGGQVDLQDVVLRGNRASAPAGAASGGGLHVYDNFGGSVTMLRVAVANNAAAGLGGGGGGIQIDSGPLLFSDFVMEDCEVVGNLANGSSSAGGGLDAAAGDDSFFFSRNIFFGNSSPQLKLNDGDFTTVLLESSLFAGSPGSSLDLSSVGAGSTFVVRNVTAVGDVSMNLDEMSGASNSGFLDNSIVTGSVTTTSVVSLGINLIGGDPRFVNPVRHNYRLRPVSPAIDAGNNTPPGLPGLGSQDLDGRARIQGPFVDLGAYERRARSGG